VILDELWFSLLHVAMCDFDHRYATGQRLTSAESCDFGYLVTGDGCCDDAEDFLMEVLGSEP
jgi:hypothetical protein